MDRWLGLALAAKAFLFLHVAVFSRYTFFAVYNAAFI